MVDRQLVARILNHLILTDLINSVLMTVGRRFNKGFLSTPARQNLRTVP